MRSSILTVVIVVLTLPLFQLAVFAQNKAVTEAPVSWERYRASGRSESVLLPKLPTAIEPWVGCGDVYIKHYYAYAEDAVYEFTLTYKGKLVTDKYCTPKRFGRSALEERLKEVRGTDPANVETVESKNGGDIHVFSSDVSSRWLIPDMANDHWVELAIYHRPGVIVDDSKFTNSLDLFGGQGKEIGDGSPTTLGDAGVDTSSTSTPPNIKDPANEALRVIAKPKAAYTDVARRQNEQGHVTLKIVFLANGGVGTVTVVEGLNYGLTENAVAAAKKVVFLPKKVNGVPVTVVMTFQYGFNIY